MKKSIVMFGFISLISLPSLSIAEGKVPLSDTILVMTSRMECSFTDLNTGKILGSKIVEFQKDPKYRDHETSFASVSFYLNRDDMGYAVALLTKKEGSDKIGLHLERQSSNFPWTREVVADGKVSRINHRLDHYDFSCMPVELDYNTRLLTRFLGDACPVGLNAALRSLLCTRQPGEHLVRSNAVYDRVVSESVADQVLGKMEPVRTGDEVQSAKKTGAVSAEK